MIPKRQQENNGRARVFLPVPFLGCIIRRQPSFLMVIIRIVFSALLQLIFFQARYSSLVQTPTRIGPIFPS